MKTITEIKSILKDVKDPEIPVISIEDLGILRDVKLEDDFYILTITTTYSGCPAMDTIKDDIHAILHDNNISNFKIIDQLNPPWTTDWISEKGREEMEKYGIAPPLYSSLDKRELLGKTKIKCPQCKSENNRLISRFGSTACKALYKCEDCQEPFDYFKCI